MQRVLRVGIGAYNSLHRYLRPFSKPVPDLPELREIEERAASFRDDISEHLSTIFSETLAIQPRLIVELGVLVGSSRFAFERAAKVTGAFLLSVDLDDCSAACTKSPKWHFVQADDVKLAAEFKGWCSLHGIPQEIDVLFIDTSHLYEHTVQEINAWFPHLAPRCKVIFHDTNLTPFYRRLDGTIRQGWDNQRGVTRAIEEYLGAKFNEKINFVTTINGWVVRHWPFCSGLTTIERI